MQPTYQDGQVILVNRLAYTFSDPQIGDCVVFKNPTDNRFSVKRIETIGNNNYYVVGDNREESTDSRNFGWIEKKNIVGKVIHIF